MQTHTPTERATVPTDPTDTAIFDDLNPTDVFDFDALRNETPQWDGERTPTAPWDPCILCSRPVRTDRPFHEIGLYGDHLAVAHEVLTDEMQNHPLWSGAFTIGPHCRRKLPKRFVWRVKR